jgi:hypothetical protein
VRLKAAHNAPGPSAEGSVVEPAEAAHIKELECSVFDFLEKWDVRAPIAHACTQRMSRTPTSCATSRSYRMHIVKSHAIWYRFDASFDLPAKMRSWPARVICVGDTMLTPVPSMTETRVPAAPDALHHILLDRAALRHVHHVAEALTNDLRDA